MSDMRRREFITLLGSAAVAIAGEMAREPSCEGR
jgi:hypothetical protein